VKINRCYLIFVVAIIALNMLACASKQAGVPSDVQTSGDNANAQPEMQQGSISGAKAAGGTVFRGSISDKKIQMMLRREGEQLTGTYFYSKIGSDISLKGSIDKQGNFKLQELDNSGKQTGEFKGKWSDPANLPSATLEGTWSKPNSDQTLSFYATEQMVEFTSGLRVVTKEIKEDDKKKKFWIHAEYPELTGAANAGADKFNREVKQLVTKETQEFKEGESEMSDEDLPIGDEINSFIEISYDITHATDNLISVIFGVSTYSRGAAHPNHHTFVINYDLKSATSLKLSDLFKPDSNYLQTISRYCIDDLKKQAGKDNYMTEMIEDGAGPQAENFQSWNISKKGLAITFDPYQVASYAEGPKNVIVPHAALKDEAKPGGPLSAVMN